MFFMIWDGSVPWRCSWPWLWHLWLVLGAWIFIEKRLKTNACACLYQGTYVPYVRLSLAANVHGGHVSPVIATLLGMIHLITHAPLRDVSQVIMEVSHERLAYLLFNGILPRVGQNCWDMLYGLVIGHILVGRLWIAVSAWLVPTFLRS